MILVTGITFYGLWEFYDNKQIMIKGNENFMTDIKTNDV